MSTATHWLRELVSRRGDAIAIVEPDGESVSFVELEARVAALSGGLREAGLGRGDRLASFVPNGLLPVELLLAAARLGAVTIGVNTRYRADDLRHVLERARPRLLVAAERFLDIDFPAIVASALDGLTPGPRVLWPSDIDDARTAEPLLDDAATPDDLLVAFTTSGTTGRPKLAAHDHRTTIRHLRAAARALDIEPTSTALLALPFCGTFGFVSLLAALAGGARVVVPTHFVPAATAATMHELGVTHLNGSDDMLLAVLDAGRDVSSWRHGVQAEFNGRGRECVTRADAVGVRVTGVYGSSETFAVLASQSPSDPVPTRARNGGTPVDASTEVRAVDTSTGEPLPPGEPGELHLRGPSVLSAYLTEDTAEPPERTADGWFATGDLAVVEANGGFEYVARLGDALRLAGFLTDPAEIEQRLLAHEMVTGAQVVGAPSRKGGEVAVAFVTTTRAVTEVDLVAHCRQGLANYKVPARVVVIDAFPTVAGANGVKVQKAVLRQRAADLAFTPSM
jgi:acyl-CoA synthetase (AMP-forming)/AMP-acid ligase II